MYPRTEEERSRGRNCGFVKFREKEDAELAMDELDGIILFGYEMKLGWGKAMPKHSSGSGYAGLLTMSHIAPNLNEIAQGLIMNPTFPKIQVEPPEDESVRSVIDCVSRLVASVSTFKKKNQYLGLFRIFTT